MRRDALFKGQAPNSVAQVHPTRPWSPLLPGQTDALADPQVEDIAESLYQLLPPGPAWRSPDAAAFDANSRLGGFLRALARDLVRLYRRVFGLTLESTASTLADSLDDWEADFGLPDICFGDGQTASMRRRVLLARVRDSGTISPRDFVELATVLGYQIEIEEPRPFEFGGSAYGGSDQMVGGDDAGNAIQFHWIVRIAGVTSDRFEFGVSQYGLDRYLDFNEAHALECVFRRIAPAWTRPIFDYS